uniref:Methylthioribulose-1-phosphate dehydratase n=1 Tax=Candidatus Kentrum sp. LPFa TaxID=2126335 RepID=A0A450W2C2_9GAMM|nr:MAG: methylthioribulose-1-phosphate dehydratase [Candidatus Kentron sp. LPFa]VFK27568.1 MAG: methylthioribulose-1-phosphate dehydratase [Candidatus Kentron sp. LPFa]
MVPATSGNLSARLPEGNLLITVSGRHKGKLTRDDLLMADARGNSLDSRRPSAETGLHVQAYHRHPEINAVLHPHSVNATVLSELHEDALFLQDYEMLKAFSGVDSHTCRVRVPIFANDQDIRRLAARVDDDMNTNGPMPGYLIEGHGFYTWGESIEDALHHVEACEFLFDCKLRILAINGPFMANMRPGTEP